MDPFEEKTSNPEYSRFIHRSRYARYRDDLGRRETWEETVDRLIDFWINRLTYEDSPSYFFPKSNFNASDIETIASDIHEAVYNLDIMGSMRSLMTAGPALDRDNVAGYNCSYLPINNVRCFDELMYILLCGTGVGYSVERKYTERLPEVAESFHETDTTIVFSDSKIGWASGFRELISLLYAGKIPNRDYSKIRPAGARLKTFGGRASGPEPLRDLCDFTVGVFKRAAGRKLTSLECHDICCKIADIVVVGGVRRSALISLSDLNDDEMRKAKSGQWWNDNPQRALANNSAVYETRPSFDTFLSEWYSLYQSKSGERGIFSREAARNQVGRSGRREVDHEWGTNPCLHPDTIIQTVNGPIAIKNITEPTYVYSMDEQGKLCIKRSSASWITKRNTPTIIIKVNSGSVLRCTPDHKIYTENRGWVEAQELHVGDILVHLSRTRRGACYSGVRLTTQQNHDSVMEHRLIWEGVYGNLTHEYDIHHIDGDTYNNTIDNLECLTHSAHATVTRLESPNNHQEHGYRDYCPGRHGSTWGFVSGPNSKKGNKKIVLLPEEYKTNLYQQPKVTSIEESDPADVYDLYVEDTHNFIANNIVVHNCSEILLRPFQFCNLTEVVVRPDDTLETLKRKVRLATIVGTLQSTLVDFRYLRRIWKKNTEEERLLGVSLTGIMDHPVLNDPHEIVYGTNWLEELKQVAIETNKEWAEKLGINESTAITCVKPSGTVSQLVDSASGIHPRYARHYLRTVRADKKDPLAQFMIDKGFYYEEDAINPHNYVFYFPMKSPDSADLADEVESVQQLQLWETYQEHWCEHKPSMTCYYTDDSFLDVGAWVWHNLDKISGVSFLPYSDHVYKQAPYIPVDEDTYNEWLKKMPRDVDWLELAQYEQEDNTTGQQELACVAGACEI